jgi:hypothetical protein
MPSLAVDPKPSIASEFDTPCWISRTYSSRFSRHRLAPPWQVQAGEKHGGGLTWHDATKRRGHRLIATDVDAAVGEGTSLHLAAQDVLLVLTGRRELAEVGARPAGETP